MAERIHRHVYRHVYGHVYTDAHLKEMAMPIGDRVKLLRAVRLSARPTKRGASMGWTFALVAISAVSVGVFVKMRSSR